VGVLGRLDSNKQVDLVIQAAAPLLRPGVTLLIVGDGNKRARLEDPARRREVADRVVFAGERNDVGAMLSAMDLLVAASRQETFGLSVVEALANGLPVLYTTSPALDGLNVRRARWVPGTVAGIRDAMATEVNVGRRDRAPEPAVKSEYNIQTVVPRIDDLYEQLAAQCSRRRTIARPAGVFGLRDRRPDGLPSAINGSKNVMAVTDWHGPIRDGRLDQRDPWHGHQNPPCPR